VDAEGFERKRIGDEFAQVEQAARVVVVTAQRVGHAAFHVGKRAGHAVAENASGGSRENDAAGERGDGDAEEDFEAAGRGGVEDGFRRGDR
jgi:hypothetical protein